MIFSLEALRARHGDALILHYGTATAPRFTLVDGGPGGVYGETLRPRLEALLGALRQAGRVGRDDPLLLDLIMVSHIDDDHIGGLLGLTDELLDGTSGGTRWVRTKTLWHNAFGDLADDDGALAELPAPGSSDDVDGAAVLASVKQGRRLQAEAELLGWPANAPFDGLVRAPASGGRKVALDDATSVLVVSPRDDQIEGLRQEWIEQMRKIRAKEAGPAEVAEYLDDSPFNLSSIVVLVRQGSRSMLLTGDARGDHILSGLDAAGVTTGGSVHVDVLKLPHHGSIRNLKDEFFARVTADHYVISADGKNGNPETASLELISGSRSDDDFTIHLTYREGAGDLGRRLEDYVQRERDAARTFGVAPRDDAAPSLAIDLGDPRVA
jgi:hypothetical protein